MAKTIVPTEFKTHIIDQVLESITESSNTAYYAFIGNHVAQGSTEEEVTQPTQTVRQTNTETYRNMIIGKKLAADDIMFVVNRYDWEAGTVFEMYDDEKINLFASNFYTVVDETAYKHVYKCLSNANGAPSTSKPLFKDAQYDSNLFVSGDDYYETNDGYQWKYMYSIDSQTFNKFATQKYIPIVANTAVQENATAGSINVIRVITHGKNYNNYKTGQFAAEDFNRITSTIISTYPGTSGMTDPANWYRITDNPAQATNFYKNTVLYLTSGVGAGQYQSIIESRYVTGIGVVVKVAQQFLVAPDDSTTYEITPEVRILGNGTETLQATARAVINANASNSIHRIEMLEIGSDYTYAEARVLTGAAADINGGISGDLIQPTEATIRPILSPQGGHGSNTAVELGASRISFFMKFNRDENGLVSAENTFGQFGIIRDPKFANVAIYYDSSPGTFVDAETVEQITKSRIFGTWQSNTDISTYVVRSDVIEDDADYDNYFTTSKEKVFITNENATESLLTTVAAGSNSTAISLSDTIPWLTAGSNETLLVYSAKTIATGIINNVSPPLPVDASSGILINKAVPNFQQGQLIYGDNSRNTANVVGIDINNRIGSGTSSFQFEDYNQLTKIQGTTVETFYNDELVTQQSEIYADVSAGGYIHSWNNNELSLSRVTGKLEAASNNPLIGGTSGAIFNNVPGDTLDITYGDLDPTEGAVIYLQNDIPVSRAENQSEEIRVILEF